MTDGVRDRLSAGDRRFREAFDACTRPPKSHPKSFSVAHLAQLPSALPGWSADRLAGRCL